MYDFILMILLLSNNNRWSTAGIRIVSKPVGRFPSTLHASFFQDLQATFSYAFSTMKDEGSRSKYYTVGITGSNGLVGKALINELSRRDSIQGKPIRIVRMVRGTCPQEKEFGDFKDIALVWNPNGSTGDQVISTAAASQIDAIVHLAGENVATGLGLGLFGFLGFRPWTVEKKAEILSSRLNSIRALSKVVSSVGGPNTFLCAGGVGAYGPDFVDENAASVDESADTSKARGFLAQISRECEAAAQEAKKGGKRVVNMRFGVVLSSKGGALAKLLPIFSLGGGGIIGSGTQYFSFISARDLARAIVHTLETDNIRGPVNFCAPYPCTNAEFTKALGHCIGRPTILPLPGFAVSLLFGEMGEEMLLGGVRAVPGQLSGSFLFLHPTIDDAIKSALEEDV